LDRLHTTDKMRNDIYLGLQEMAVLEYVKKELIKKMRASGSVS
jgi:hypothetical protein